MLVITAAKIFVFMGCMFPLGCGALGTGIVFASFNIALARNPEESESLFNNSLTAFALIETFIFVSLVVSVIVYKL